MFEMTLRFVGKRGYYVKLDSEILKMMHLPNRRLIDSVTGTTAVVLKTAKRTHFFIHCDCLDYHYINNNVSDIIKTVANSAQNEERVLLSFQDPHYYAVARRPVSNINMYITDGFFDNILNFHTDIVFTIHFRKCLHSS